MNRSMMRILLIGLFLLIICSAQLCAHPAGPYRPDLYPPSVWYSTGDLIYVYDGIPMDSAATINSTFDCFKSYCNASRVLWRDAQIEWYGAYLNLRQDSK